MFKKILQIVGADSIFKGISFLLIPFYVNWMPEYEFGEFTFMYSILSTIPLFITLCLYSLLMKFSSTTDSQSDKTIFYSSTINFIFIFAITIILLITLFGWQNFFFIEILKITNLIDIKWILFCLIAFFSSLNLIHFAHGVTFKNAKIIIKYNALKILLINGFAVCLLFLNPHEDTVVSRLFGIFIGELILCIICFFWIGKRYYIFHIDKIYILKVLKLASPLIPSSIIAIIIAGSDRYFIASSLGLEYVAQFNLAMLILIPISLIVNSAQTIIGPYIFSTNNDSDAIKNTKFYIFVFLIFFILIAFIMASISYAAIEFNIIPATYNELHYLVLLLSLPVALQSLLGFVYNLFIRSEKTYLGLYVQIFSGFFIVLGGYIFIPIYGFTGAALNSFVVYFFSILFAFKINSLIKT